MPVSKTMKHGGSPFLYIYKFLLVLWKLIAFICVVCILVGLWIILIRKDEYSKRTLGYVIDSRCDRYNVNRLIGGSYIKNDCILLIGYQVEGQQYTTRKQEKSDVFYLNGMTVPVYYNPANPQLCIIKSRPLFLALWLLGFGFSFLFIVILSWYAFYSYISKTTAI